MRNAGRRQQSEGEMEGVGPTLDGIMEPGLLGSAARGGDARTGGEGGLAGVGGGEGAIEDFDDEETKRGCSHR